jgi:hypothetical protein
MAFFLRDNFRSKHRFVTTDDFQTLAPRVYQKAYPGADRPLVSHVRIRFFEVS